MGYKVMQIETSNHCSLKCSYCPHPGQVRSKGDMTIDTFKKCLAVVKRSKNPVVDGRKFVWLNHFGEPLLNKQLPEMIRLATEAKVEVSFATNGVDHNNELFPRQLWKELRDCGLKGVMLSAHSKSLAELCKQLSGLVGIISAWEPKPGFFHDWAGQIVLPKSRQGEKKERTVACDYETHNMFAIGWDGSIASCCYDVECSTGLSVDDVLRDGFSFKPIGLCKKCNLGVGDSDWIRLDQGAGALLIK